MLKELTELLTMECGKEEVNITMERQKSMQGVVMSFENDSFENKIIASMRHHDLKIFFLFKIFRIIH